MNKETKTYARISDLYGVIPSITGKIELVYEGEQEGPSKVAHILISKSIRRTFAEFFPTPDKLKKNQDANIYQEITNWFNKGNHIDLLNDLNEKDYEQTINKVPGLSGIVKKFFPKTDKQNHLLLMEFVLYGLTEYSLLSRFKMESGIQFKDMLSSMFTMSSEDDNDESDNDIDFYR